MAEAAGDSTVRDSTVRDSTVRDSTVRDSTVRDSTVRDSTVRDSASDDTSEATTPVALHPILVELTEWAAEQRRRDARRAQLIAEAHRLSLAEAQTGHHTAAWLAGTFQLPRSRARALQRTSEHLVNLHTVLLEALAEGRISWAHVETYERAANPRIREVLADLLPHLIDLAEVATFERWARELRGIVERLDEDGGFDPTTRPGSNDLNFSTSFDGVVHVSGQLFGELALIIQNLVNHHAEKVMERYRRDAENTDGQISVPSYGQARAEALADLVDRGAAAHPDHKGVEPEIVVILDAESGEVTDESGERIHPVVLRWILAAGFIRPLEVSGTGDPLRVGHTLRYANRQQRRALAVRDGGCVFPGCTHAPSACDAHHVHHWDSDNPTAGGPTDIDNLALLCRHHHRVTHRPRWTMRRQSDPPDPDAITFEWVTPRGNTITSQRHGIPWHRAA